MLWRTQRTQYAGALLSYFPFLILAFLVRFPCDSAMLQLWVVLVPASGRHVLSKWHQLSPLVGLTAVLSQMSLSSHIMLAYAVEAALLVLLVLQ